MMKRNGNRVVAFLLAMLMVASTMGSTSLTAYAQGTATDVEIVTEESMIEEFSTEESSQVGATEAVSEEADLTIEETVAPVTEETNAEELITEETNAAEENMDVVLEDTVEEEETPAYTGTEGVYENSWLIDANGMIEAGMEFNDANLIAIAEYYESLGQTFETVQIQYPDDSKYSYTISKDVWNAMRRIQNDNGSDEDSAGIDFIFPTVSGNCVMTWHFRYIMEATSDVVMDMDWTINEAEQGIGVSFSNVTFPASFVDVQIRVGTLYGEYTDFCNAFKKEYDGVLYDASGKFMNGIIVVNNVVEGSDCYFVIKGVGNLTADADYTVNNKKYTGNLRIDSDGIVSLSFYINDFEMEELPELIRANKGQGVNKIWIDEEVEGNYRHIPVDVINAATEILTDLPEEITWDVPALNIGSYGKGLDVMINRPIGTLEGDTAIFSMDTTVSGNEPKVKVTIPEINADCVMLRQNFTEESIQDPFKELFDEGEGVFNLFIGDDNYPVSYFNVGGNSTFTVNDAIPLENNTWYKIKDPTGGAAPGVPGDVTVNPFEGFLTLEFRAEEIGQEVLGNGDIAESLSYYKEQIEAGEMEPFRYIYIHQKNTDNDIIYKDDFNFVRSLLTPDESVYAGIYYYFETPATVSGNEVENSEQWYFPRPKEATKDMDVSDVSIRMMRNCIKVKFPENTYPTDNVGYTRILDSRLDEAKKLYASFHNQTDNNSSGFRIFSDPEKLTELYYATCIFWDYSYDDTTECALDIGWVNKLGTEECTMVKYLEDEPLYIGEPTQFKTTFTPDEGSKINYRNVTTYAKIDDKGVITPVSEGTAMYMASYLLDGEWTVDYWHTNVSKKLLSMKFANASITNPLEMEVAAEGSDAPNTEQLKISYYPTGTTPAPDELEWFVGTVSDNSVSANNIQLETDINGNPTGKIIAVSEGEAVVTVTHKENPNVCAKAKIVVKPNLNDEESKCREALEEQGIYAISNLDKTLADVKLPEESGYKWVDESITLASQDMGGLGQYPAIYKSPIDGREKNVLLSVDLRTFILDTELYLNNENIFTDKIVMDHGDVLHIDAWGEDWGSGESDLLDYLLTERNLHFECVLSSNPEDIVQESDSPYYKWMFTADSAKSGKKNFTAELFVVHNDTGEKISIEKQSFTVTVAKKPIMNWKDMNVVKATNGEAFGIDVSSPKGELGEFVLMQPKEEAFGLTVKSLDPKVCKIIKQQSPQEDGDHMVTRVSYECLAGGKAQISVTAKDEVKSNIVYQFDVIDVMPRALESTVTIDVNRTEEEQTDSVEWLLNAGTTILGEEEELLLGDNEGLFNIDGKEGNDVKLHLVNEDDMEGTVELCAELINPSIKKGKYKVDVTAPVMYGDGQSAYFTTTVTINITDVKPKVTLKQTKKVNLFYTDEQSYGEFTLTPSMSSIDSVEFAAPQNKTCDYVIEETDKLNTYIVKLDENATTDKNKSGILKVNLNGYRDSVEVKFSIKTENKKPTLVLSQKTDALYPNYTADVTSVLQFTDKATGKTISNISVVEYKKDKDFVVLEAEGTSVKGNKNTYTVTADTDNITFVLEEGARQKTTDKFSLKIKGDNWKTSIPVSYSIKVETTKPKLVLSTKTINFNMNEKVYYNEVAYVDLAFKGVAGGIEDIGKVTVWAYPGESQTALNKWISVEYVDGRVRVALEDIEGLTKSSYTWKFDVEVFGEGNSYYVWDTLTVKITNTAPEKCISASAKGSIDVLDDTKCITYTPKLKNVQGIVVGGRLTGKDAEMFTTVFEDGVLKVYTKQGIRYNTKTKYSVVPEFTVKNADGKTVKLDLGKVQTIKVKQGKPKLKADKVTWYRDRQSDIEIPVSAVLNGKDVSIMEMKLTNFTNDLGVWYDSENGCIRLNLIGNRVDKMNAIGKTYNLKFNVYYADRAVNEKPASITIKLTVK